MKVCNTKNLKELKLINQTFSKLIVDNKEFTSLVTGTSTRSKFRAATASKMEHFVIIVNGFHPLTIISNCSILDVAAVLDPPLVDVPVTKDVNSLLSP